MSLDTRVKRLEAAQGDSGQSGGGYDQQGDYRNHIWYMQGEEGRVSCVESMYDDHRQLKFACEEDLWKVYPAGTKFLRAAAVGTWEVIDGVMRKLNFPPVDGKINPELAASVAHLLPNLQSLYEESGAC